MSKIFKIANVEIKNVDKEKHTVEVIVSTENKDSDGDIILATAFNKNMKRYKSNPVLLNSHNYRDVQNIIGKALNLKSSEKGLKAVFEYLVGKGNPAADWAFKLAESGIAAFSIGFIGKDYEWIREKREDGTEFITGRKFKEVELLEISQVTVPANKDAVLEARNHKNAELKLLEAVEKAFVLKTLEETELLDTEESQEEKPEEKINKPETEDKKSMTSIYETELLGDSDNKSTEHPQSEETQEQKPEIKVDVSEIEKLTQETLK